MLNQEDTGDLDLEPSSMTFTLPRVDSLLEPALSFIVNQTLPFGTGGLYYIDGLPWNKDKQKFNSLMRTAESRLTIVVAWQYTRIEKLLPLTTPLVATV